VAEHDETTPLSGEELLREAERIRFGASAWIDDDPDPTVVAPVHGEVRRPLAPTGFTTPVGGPSGVPRLRDPGALLVGIWFAVAGVVAALLGESTFDDVPPVIVPVSFAVVGLGLLVPKRR